MNHHGHDHHHHSHHHAASNGEKTLNWAIFANILLTVAQVIGGLVSGSLSLIADAIHNLSDAAALIVASLGIRIGKRPADKHKTFGYKRAETISALINFVVLVSIGFFLCIEAIERLMNPQVIEGMLVVYISIIALIVDVVTAVIIFKRTKDSMNMKAAFAHNIADAAASVAVLISGLLIHFFSWFWIDPLLTFAIAAYIIWHGLHGLPRAIHLLMDGTPHDLDMKDIIQSIESVNGVENAHHMHIWQIDEWKNALESHVVIQDISKIETVKTAIKEMLLEKYEITHSTLEFEDVENRDCFLETGTADCHDH